MPVTSTPRALSKETARSPLALAVADANWFTTENLFREVSRPEVNTLLLTCVDYYNAWQRGAPPWKWGQPLRMSQERLWQRDLVLPSGWMKSFPHWGMRPISRAISQWRERYASEGRLALVMTYPHYVYLRDLVRPDVTVYYNIDDYSQYWPHCADRVNELERQAVRESDLTVCVSRVRCEELQRAVPEAADRIRHLPHGTPSGMLDCVPSFLPGPAPADLAPLPRPYLGYVGTLEDRVDWPLLTKLAQANPNASLILVGRLAGNRSAAWQTDAKHCLSLPNVHLIGWRPQEELIKYNRAFDLCLIPYRADHPFNRVCCPTKIMDYMASGRPIVSTNLPECALHSERFDVVETHAGFLDAVTSILASPPNPERIAARFQWASDHRCSKVVERLLDWLPS